MLIYLREAFGRILCYLSPSRVSRHIHQSNESDLRSYHVPNNQYNRIPLLALPLLVVWHSSSDTRACNCNGRKGNQSDVNYQVFALYLIKISLTNGYSNTYPIPSQSNTGSSLASSSRDPKHSAHFSFSFFVLCGIGLPYIKRGILLLAFIFNLILVEVGGLAMSDAASSTVCLRLFLLFLLSLEDIDKGVRLSRWIHRLCLQAFFALPLPPNFF